MARLTIQSNGRLENTKICYNEEQISGVKKLLIMIDADGTFQFMLQYKGTDGLDYTRDPFAQHLDRLHVVGAEIGDDDPYDSMHEIVIESDGVLDNTYVMRDGNTEEGIQDLFILIEKAESEAGLVRSLFGKKERVESKVQAHATYLDEDGELVTENLF
jgi:hypothetical protein